MRAVVQRVLNASVAVEGQIISQIGRGLMVLVGISRDDTPDDAAWVIKKILNAKLWPQDEVAWKQSVVDLDAEVLCVSQFTLFANFKGTKPDFHASMVTAFGVISSQQSTEPGKAFYHAFLDQIRAAYTAERIKDGQFGAMMQVSLCNDGPVTVTFDSKDRDRKRGSGSTSASGANTPTKSDADVAAIARAKNEARAAKKAEWLARKAAGDVPDRP